MNHFNDKCKKNKFGVSLKIGKGFKTFNPQSPINFWIYVPQNLNDKAPIKDKNIL